MICIYTIPGPACASWPSRCFDFVLFMQIGFCLTWGHLIQNACFSLDPKSFNRSMNHLAFQFRFDTSLYNTSIHPVCSGSHDHLQVCDALESFQGSAKPSTSMASSGTHSKGVFFFMCFFVNNQYRHTADGVLVGYLLMDMFTNLFGLLLIMNCPIAERLLLTKKHEMVGTVFMAHLTSLGLWLP